ncbi:MAG: hypothetical protein CME40_01315 [Haliea sp.]|nr:hypothetical protein [Haliea sp.]
MIPDTASTPWYRQFWPWFLIALPGSVVIASFYMLYIATRHADDLVVTDYYKEGLAINRQLEMQQSANELSLRASLALAPRQVTVHLQGSAADDSLALLLSHPLEADRDQQVTLKRVAPGVYVGALPQPAGERWHWRLSGESAGQPWRLDGVIHAADLVPDAPG